METVGERLRAWRKEKGLSTVEISKKLDFLQGDYPHMREMKTNWK